jgi:hypothetical protein
MHDDRTDNTSAGEHAMKKQTRLMLKPVAVALAASLLVSTIAMPVNAAEKSYSELDSVTYNGWGDPAMAHIAVTSGRALIDHLMTARALLKTNQYDQARSALIASREFTDAIERIMPYLTVAQELKDASDRVIEEKVDVLKSDLLPIYASLDELAVFAPEAAKKSKSMVRHAQQHAAAGDRARAAKELKEAAAEVTLHTVYLPVDYVNQQVRVAQYALAEKQPDVKTASTAVDKALHSLVVVIDTVEQSAAGEAGNNT